MVGQALKGASLIPLDRLEINNIHSFGGCVVLEDAAHRYSLPALLAPLSQRNGALVQALIFGGLLFPPSVAPFYVESRPVRLATFCGLDPDQERFELPDLTAALRELDQSWPLLRSGLIHPPHAEVRAIIFFKTSRSPDHLETGALGMDADGIPVPLAPEEAGAADPSLNGLARQVAQVAHVALHSKTGPPLLVLDEETAKRIRVEAMEKQPYLIELSPESLSALLKQLNQAQLLHSLRAGGPVEVRHHGERYILKPTKDPRVAESQESTMRMGSLKELKELTEPAPPPSLAADPAGTIPAAGFQAVRTNVPAERLPAAAAMLWATRAQSARAAFSPVRIVAASSPMGDGVILWRNHQNLQFLTHRLRCHLQAEWHARGETRPVEEVIRELHEVHRATLTVDGVVVRRLATRPSKAVATLLARLDLWELFESPDIQTRG